MLCPVLGSLYKRCGPMQKAVHGWERLTCKGNLREQEIPCKHKKLKEKKEILSKKNTIHKRRNFSVRVVKLWKMLLTGCVMERHSKPDWRGFWAACSSWARGWTSSSPEVPLNFSSSVIMWFKTVSVLPRGYTKRAADISVLGIVPAVASVRYSN